MSTKIFLFTSLSFALLLACDHDQPHDAAPESEHRTPRGTSQPSSGSCVTDEDRPLCDGPGVGDCFCDDDCESYGDCCDDFADVCISWGEVCTNGEDDNFDGLTDCDDPLCAGGPECTDDDDEAECDSGGEDDGEDDGADEGAAEGDDSAPADDGTEDGGDVPDEPFGEFCGNGEDDNGNDLYDCDDPLCAEDPACQSVPEEYSCVDSCGAQAPGGCWCDGECSTYGDCCVDVELFCPAEVFSEFCGNGEDDNGDGLIDCEDPDCAAEC